MKSVYNIPNNLGEGVYFEISIECCKIKSGLHLIIEGVKYDLKDCLSRSRLALRVFIIIIRKEGLVGDCLF